MRSRAVERIGDVRNLRAHQFVEDAGPLAHPVRPEVYHEINNFYTTTIYEKGAEVIRMLQACCSAPTLSARAWICISIAMTAKPRPSSNSCSCFADASGRDLSQFMRWYSQAGTPDVVADGQYDAAEKTYTLHLTQSLAPTPGQPVKEPMVIPLRTRAGRRERRGPAAQVRRQAVACDVITLTGPSQTIVFEQVAERPVLSINREFSAPVKLTANLSADDLRRLAAHDSDAFNRWQALQTLATRLLLKNVEPAARRSAAGHRRWLARGAVARSSPTQRLEPAFVALALTMPTESDIAREIGRDVDPAREFRSAHAFAIRDRRRALGSALAATYDALHHQGALQPGRRECRTPRAEQHRARPAGSDRTAGRDRPRDGAIPAGRQHDRPDGRARRPCRCMTVRNAPRRCRTSTSAIESDPLIIDKWLGLQAMIPETGTLDRVRALTAHPAFSMNNPNRVRALIGSFAHGNATQFNRAGRCGLRIRRRSRAGARRQEPASRRAALPPRSGRGARLKPAGAARRRRRLRRIAAASALSADVNDIVNRALASS